jgi:hypothetical protein
MRKCILALVLKVLKSIAVECLDVIQILILSFFLADMSTFNFFNWNVIPSLWSLQHTML